MFMLIFLHSPFADFNFFFYTAVLSTVFANELQLLCTLILVSICVVLVHKN